LDCCVLGLGYIGLPTAAVIAESGLNVLGIDLKPEVIDTINDGRIHITEPYLGELVRRVVQDGRLRASLVPESSPVYIIAVPTPFNSCDVEIPSPDLSFVKSAVQSIAPVLKPSDLIIIESTSPVGTTEEIASLLSDSIGFPVEDLYLAYCPERVLPGNILHELKNNDRTIGGLNEQAAQKASDFYARFCSGNLNLTNSRTAELVKLVENSYRDVNIAFANELSLVCQHFNLNAFDVIRHANYHPRVNILQPGVGVGGHCIAVDPWFIASAVPNNSLLIQAARKVNNSMPGNVASRVVEYVATGVLNAASPVVACLGLTYKPNVDDIRESPALDAALLLSKAFENLVCFDPYIQQYPDLSFSSLENLLSEADLIVILVAHDEFKDLPHSRFKHLIDVCGLYSV